nr:MAG TPA: hypothetical protein [Caudoviricetes sp.]
MKAFVHQISLSITTLFSFGGIMMKKEPLTITQKSTIFSSRWQAKQLLRQLRPEEAVKIYNEVVKEIKNVREKSH